jgi:hypothetical protein
MSSSVSQGTKIVGMTVPRVSTGHGKDDAERTDSAE